MGSWLLKLLSRDMKTNKDQLTNIKNNKRIKAKVNITYTIDHYPKNR